MKQTSEFAQYVVEQMQILGPVMAKRMFGGEGIFLDGLMIGLIGDDELYLKTDSERAGYFVGEGLEQFTYYKQGKAVKMSYHLAPEDVFDDPAVMRVWGQRAMDAALRGAAKKRSRQREQR